MQLPTPETATSPYELVARGESLPDTLTLLTVSARPDSSLLRVTRLEQIGKTAMIPQKGTYSRKMRQEFGFEAGTKAEINQHALWVPPAKIEAFMVFFATFKNGELADDEDFCMDEFPLTSFQRCDHTTRVLPDSGGEAHTLMGWTGKFINDWFQRAGDRPAEFMIVEDAPSISDTLSFAKEALQLFGSPYANQLDTAMVEKMKSYLQ